MRAVPVHLDAGAGFRFALGVSADVRAAVQHHHVQAQLGGASFRDRQPEQAGPDDQQIGHCVDWASTTSTRPPATITTPSQASGVTLSPSTTTLDPMISSRPSALNG